MKTLKQAQKPNLFLVGAPKCGTTAMATYLKSHPQFCLAVDKEPDYWATEICRKVNGITSNEEYLLQFRPRPETKVICDASTSTIWSKTAIQNIMQYNPDAKFIAMLRNPTDLVRSLHWETCCSCGETEFDFEKAWELQETRSQGKEIPACCVNPVRLQYRMVGKIGEQLKRFYDLVPEEQRHVVLLDDMISDTRGVYKQILDFLGMDDDGKMDFPRIRPSSRQRMPRLAMFLKYPPFMTKSVNMRLKFAAHRLGFRGFRTAMVRRMAVPQKPPEISPEMSAELQQIYAEDIDIVESLLNRDLSAWRNGKKVTQ